MPVVDRTSAFRLFRLTWFAKNCKRQSHKISPGHYRLKGQPLRHSEWCVKGPMVRHLKVKSFSTKSPTGRRWDVFCWRPSLKTDALTLPSIWKDSTWLCDPLRQKVSEVAGADTKDRQKKWRIITVFLDLTPTLTVTVLSFHQESFRHGLDSNVKLNCLLCTFLLVPISQKGLKAIN